MLRLFPAFSVGMGFPKPKSVAEDGRTEENRLRELSHPPVRDGLGKGHLHYQGRVPRSRSRYQLASLRVLEEKEVAYVLSVKVCLFPSHVLAFCLPSYVFPYLVVFFLVSFNQ